MSSNETDVHNTIQENDDSHNAELVPTYIENIPAILDIIG